MYIDLDMIMVLVLVVCLKVNLLCHAIPFNITSVSSETITYKDDKIEYTIPVCDFHKNFYLGFCITVHASQGDSINQKYTIYDWKIDCFCDKAKYVAMSRSTDINNI